MIHRTMWYQISGCGGLSQPDALALWSGRCGLISPAFAETLEEAISVVFEVSDAINRAIDAGVPEKKIRSILNNSVLPLS